MLYVLHPRMKLFGTTLLSVTVVFDVVIENEPPKVKEITVDVNCRLALSVILTVKVAGQLSVSGVPADALLVRPMGLAREMSVPGGGPGELHVKSTTVVTGVKLNVPPWLAGQMPLLGVLDVTGVVQAWHVT